jgi:protein TonB
MTGRTIRGQWLQQYALAFSVTLAIHVLLLGCLMQYEMDKQLPEPKIKAIQMQFIHLPKAQVVTKQQPKPEQLPVAKPDMVVQKKTQQSKPFDVKPPAIQKIESKPIEPKTSLAKPVLNNSEGFNKMSRPVADSNAAVANAATANSTTTASTRSTETHIVSTSNDKSKIKEKDAEPIEQHFDIKGYLPVSKQAPDYPTRAMDQGLEGECTVSYTVNAQGRIENPKAEADCHPLFVRPSINAAKQFQYQPRMVNGQAVSVAQVRNVFQYRIATP